MSDAKRTVFFVSDGTGISAQTLGSSLLQQFSIGEYHNELVSFMDSESKAHECLRLIQSKRESSGVRPLVFSTIVEGEISDIIGQADALHIDLFQHFLPPLQEELGVEYHHTIGRSKEVVATDKYARRMEAINYSLTHDDGQTTKNLDKADIILVGVSRSGKTPTSLFLAMHYGIYAANYPLIPEDFDRNALPTGLKEQLPKLIGLMIDPARLHAIRNERRPGSKYASIENCRKEVSDAKRMLTRFGIPWLDSSSKSVEELSAAIIQAAGVKPVF